MSSLRKRLLARAHEMRHNPTPGERRLWDELRQRQLDNLKWRRQHVVEPFILDFYCHRAQLGVEVDGASHDGAKNRDQARDAKLERFEGIVIIRFTEDDVLHEIERVLDDVSKIAAERIAELEGETGNASSFPGAP